MELSSIVSDAKRTFYDLIGNLSKSFPGTSHLMHVTLIGVLPYAFGRYISTKIPYTKRYSATIGFGLALASEALWRFGIEPGSPYDHPDDTLYDWIGTAETGLGALAAHATAETIRKRHNDTLK